MPGKSHLKIVVRTGQGNALSVYTRQNSNNLKQAEVDLYGSRRPGIWKPLYAPPGGSR